MPCELCAEAGLVAVWLWSLEIITSLKETEYLDQAYRRVYAGDEAAQAIRQLPSVALDHASGARAERHARNTEVERARRAQANGHINLGHVGAALGKA
jgi:hypothetical protein